MPGYDLEKRCAEVNTSLLKKNNGSSIMGPHITAEAMIRNLRISFRNRALPISSVSISTGHAGIRTLLNEGVVRSIPGGGEG